MSELALAAIYCTLMLHGATEVSHGYSVGYDLHRIRVDCETSTQVIEVGLDKRSSIDSVHQAAFAALLTGKAPMVLMIDTDGREDQYEFQVRTVAQSLNIAYQVIDRDYLIRWQMTEYLRNYRAEVIQPKS
ncbi:hypothetical protein [Antarcticimicrobium sediminis]|uniref:Uncharacterized protein n=1 Tax=Antarcticimicrobium sediminis TaxID=2546227 RepID=A0A4R5ESW9_9RHOB|nr:hypothetical protein [Antarcticimicrobium sediminis]TDE37991.1 hypothetical protein E1B25_11240 [Antarcticimicrobium sediminis]